MSPASAIIASVPKSETLTKMYIAFITAPIMIAVIDVLIVGFV